MPRRGSRSEERLVAFNRRCLEDLAHWVETDPRLAARLLRLIEEVRRDPFRGIGKPEPLRQLGSDVWSRRLTEEHRVVYRVADDRIEFLQARYHY